MSMITHQDESSIIVDCLDCRFSIAVVHDHKGNQRTKWMASGEDLEKEITLSNNEDGVGYGLRKHFPTS